MQPDDIDRDLRYSQYPYLEGDKYKEDEEDMEADEQALGKVGGNRMTAPSSTRCPYCYPEATYSYSIADQTLGSPRSIHTDMDVAMEMGGLGMSSQWIRDPQGYAPDGGPSGRNKDAISPGLAEQYHERHDCGCNRDSREVCTPTPSG